MSAQTQGSTVDTSHEQQVVESWFEQSIDGLVETTAQLIKDLGEKETDILQRLLTVAGHQYVSTADTYRRLMNSFGAVVPEDVLDVATFQRRVDEAYKDD